MNWLNLLGISVGLAMDAFAVSVAVGVSVASVTPRHVFRLSFHLGLFHFMMPILGWFAGRELAPHVAAYDHWMAAGLLWFVGGKMFLDACAGNAPGSKTDLTRGVTLLTLSMAISIDALAVGFSMAFMRVSVWVPSVVIGVVAATLSAVGIGLGNRFGRRLGRSAEAVGGCVLVLIGVRILLSHLSG